MAQNRTMAIKHAKVRKIIGQEARNKAMDIACQEHHYPAYLDSRNPDYRRFTPKKGESCITVKIHEEYQKLLQNRNVKKANLKYNSFSTIIRPDLIRKVGAL